MSIYFEKARELGELLLQSEQAINLINATEEFNKDADAQAKFNEYKAYQSNVQTSMKEKKMTEEEFKKASKKLTEMAIELKEIPSIAALTFSENEFNSFINQVMNVLKFTIKGENVDSCYSGGCEGCSKGCN